MDRETYICCDPRDIAHASEIARFLESVGISTWDPAAAQELYRSQEEMLDNSRLLLLLWSQAARTSEIAPVIKIALSRAKHVIPVSLDGSRPLAGLGVDLSDYVWYDLQGNARPQLERLANATIRKLSPRDDSNSIENGLHAVRVATINVANQKSPTIRNLCKILLSAIEHGAPIYNSGDKYGCAKIYEMAAKSLHGMLLNYDLVLSERQKTAIDDIQLVSASYRYATIDNADSLAWDLRDAFDTLLEESYQTTAAGAVESIESRFLGMPEPSPTDIRRLLLFAVSHGAPLYNEGYHKECAAIYLKAALTTIVLAQRGREKAVAGRAEFFQNTERCLKPILTESEVATTDPERKYHWVLEHRAEKLAWDIRRAFDGILEYDYTVGGSIRTNIASQKEDNSIGAIERASAKPIFVCYARTDNTSADSSRRWLDRLLQQLAPLIRQADMDVWSDEDLKVGENWHAEIQRRLASAKAAVLLISPAFLASEYIANSELPVLLKKASEGGLTIVQILLSPSLYHKVRFKYPDPKTGPVVFKLSDIQSANPPSQTLEEMSLSEQNRVLVRVAEDLLEILQHDEC